MFTGIVDINRKYKACFIGVFDLKRKDKACVIGMADLSRKDKVCITEEQGMFKSVVDSDKL